MSWIAGVLFLFAGFGSMTSSVIGGLLLILGAALLLPPLHIVSAVARDPLFGVQFHPEQVRRRAAAAAELRRDLLARGRVILYPAVDILDGRAVRLVRETSPSPPSTATTPSTRPWPGSRPARGRCTSSISTARGRAGRAISRRSAPSARRRTSRCRSGAGCARRVTSTLRWRQERRAWSWARRRTETRRCSRPSWPRTGTGSRWRSTSATGASRRPGGRRTPDSSLWPPSPSSRRGACVPRQHQRRSRRMLEGGRPRGGAPDLRSRRGRPRVVGRGRRTRPPRGAGATPPKRRDRGQGAGTSWGFTVAEGNAALA